MGEMYRISSETVTPLFDQVRRITETTEPMTFIQATESLLNVTVGADLPSAESASFGVDSGEAEYGISGYTYCSTTGVQQTRGWSFTARESFSIVGLRYYEGSIPGYDHRLKLWDINGNAVREVNCQASDGRWSENIYFDTPLNVAIGETYIVSMCLHSQTSSISLAYANRPTVTFSSKLTFNEMRYSDGNNFPNNKATADVPLVDIIIAPVSAELSDTYQVQRTTMDDIAEEVQRISGTETKMTVEQIQQELSEVILQEKTVTPSAEQQVITPDSGFYGISRVTVEAVELIPSNARLYYVGEANTEISCYDFYFESWAHGSLLEG